jgi:hypothetical protein
MDACPDVVYLVVNPAIAGSIFQRSLYLAEIIPVRSSGPMAQAGVTEKTLFFSDFLTPVKWPFGIELGKPRLNGFQI